MLKRCRVSEWFWTSMGRMSLSGQSTVQLQYPAIVELRGFLCRGHWLDQADQACNQSNQGPRSEAVPLGTFEDCATWKIDFSTVSSVFRQQGRLRLSWHGCVSRMIHCQMLAEYYWYVYIMLYSDNYNIQGRLKKTTHRGSHYFWQTINVMSTSMGDLFWAILYFAFHLVK